MRTERREGCLRGSRHASRAHSWYFVVGGGRRWGKGCGEYTLDGTPVAHAAQCLALTGCGVQGLRVWSRVPRRHGVAREVELPRERLDDVGVGWRACASGCRGTELPGQRGASQGVG
eukprot:5517306-Pleurochrysis_carterae.AAC.1